MKNKVWKSVRDIIMPVMVVAMVFTGSLSIGGGVDAAKNTEQTDVVKYVEYSDDITSYLNDNTAPEYTGADENGFGYLFGGWYDMTVNGDVEEYTAIADVASYQAKKGTVVAKFVPAQTLSVKCQNWAGTVQGSKDVIVRVISATDSKNYSQFGFVVSRIDDKGNETVLTEKPFTTETVYSKFNYYAGANDAEPTATYKPSDLFGQAANHFTTCTVGKIPAEAHGTIICIKPFWDTLDGTRVYGLSKFAHVEDGYLHYVNVPVNLNILKDGTGAAAGRLSVKTDDGLTFIGAEKGVECGKVFDEMEFNVSSDADGKTIIKCVGNTSDISEKDEMDVYINLKFKKADADVNNGKPIANKFYTFTVDEEEFCTAGEELLKKDNIWNVIY